MRKRNFRTVAWLAALLLVFCLHPFSAHAAENDLDPEQLGSISLTLTYGGSPVRGGNILLYQVAELRQVDGVWQFVPVAALQDQGFDFSDLSDRTLITRLERAVANANITPLTGTFNWQGRVSFENLPLGIYLMQQTVAAEDFYPLSSALITVPMQGEDGYIYDVDARPKTELRPLPPEPPPPPPPPPTPPPTPPTPPEEPPTDIPDEPTPTTDIPDEEVPLIDIPDEDVPLSELPKTGQLNWPVPVLALLGVLLAGAGILLCRGDRKAGKDGM